MKPPKHQIDSVLCAMLMFCHDWIEHFWGDLNTPCTVRNNYGNVKLDMIYVYHILYQHKPSTLSKRWIWKDDTNTLESVRYMNNITWSNNVK